ncbi:receptor-binding cancer antigen expressed on SiSo cells-like [Limulus polyphemus]|uniref:Receptor-binding cancer antigen expressed on SiSo cells-like n=1 Tax=Limulus polyphemus TaxID=6850 RepID=A0ABM1BJ56_LIMPO|nr:receptor-binding cancer antigen expressed on SiSo cells-like [Limulus polyphemus]XP_022251101.1 receptor-binding cancer antigen expressed on SiSo cells-like [Limulus polyphemus]
MNSTVMTVLKALLAKFGRIFLVIFGVVRRAFCCFKRRRRHSDTVLPVTVNSKHQSSPLNLQAPELQSWEVWEDDMPNSVRVERNASTSGFTDQEHDVDFFKDMTPEITKPKRLLVRKPETESSKFQGLSSRLAMDTKGLVIQNSELGELEDDIESWEDVMASEDVWESDSVLKESRQAERERKLQEHQRRKQEREVKRASKQDLNLNAIKLS